ATNVGAIALEGGLIRPTHEIFDGYLNQVGVPHKDELNACGLHTWPYWDIDLAAWWPVMMSALGNPAPAGFDYRSTAPNFSVWGWTITADPQRAPEFLTASNVGPGGFTLTGSGRTAVTTAPIFAPGQSVVLTGATTTTTVADSSGRLHFQVALGAPHRD